MDQYIEWDENKALTNIRKHGITFQEAATVFDDPLAQAWFDRIENGERRWKTVGMSKEWNTLLVVHTVREDDEDGSEILRIISARLADRTERKRYEHG